MPTESQEINGGTPAATNPVFVVGVYRSGTSLLYAMLNQHPQMALMYECDVWDFPQTFSGVRFSRDWLQRQEFYNGALSRHRLIFGGSLRGLEEARTPEDLYRTFGEARNGMLYGEKSPYYCARLKQLARRHPDCSFVLLWRDPVEIYRSIVRAAREEPYFRRRGILSRLIFYHEQMLQQAAELSRAKVRICHVSYNGLIDDTRKTCGNICRFLGIEFDERMLDLASADLSAVYPGPQHNHLRQGKIERQRFCGKREDIKPAVETKLRRFGARWNRLQSRWLEDPINSSAEREPAVAERLYYRISGKLFCTLDDGKRLLFEFLPLAWLRSYRQIKKWLSVNQPVERLSPRELFATHGITILLSYAILGGVVAIDYSTGPDMTMALFYMMPSAILTLIVGRRWGIFAAAIAVTCWSAIQSIQLRGSLDLGIVTWNSVMRFLVFLTVVFLLDRVRVEAKTSGRADI